MDQPTYMCCKHCEPVCPSNNEHELTCIRGCLPYTSTRQNRDEKMNQPSSETPWFAEKTTSDIPENVPAEALQEMLDFERARWAEEKEEMALAIEHAGEMVQAFDDYILNSIVNIGALMSATDAGILEPEDALKRILGGFINDLPTPRVMDMQKHLDDDHKYTNEVVLSADILAEFLVSKGFDPDLIIAEKKQENEDFIKTLIDGFRTKHDGDEIL